MTKPFDYQERGVQRIRECKGRTLLADDPGLGKSLQALLYAYRFNKFPVIIICPACVKYHWEAEALKHCGMRAQVLETTKVPRKGFLRPEKITICNYDIAHAWRFYLRSIKAALVIVDEGQFIKSPGARRTKAVKFIAAGSKRVLILTGTPILNRPAELFTQVNLLWPLQFPHRQAYLFRYCGPKRRPWAWEFKGATHTEELHQKLKACGMIRRRKSKVMKDLPPKIVSVIPLQIAGKQAYEKAEDAFRQWLRENIPRMRKDRDVRAQYLTRYGYMKRYAASIKMKSVCEWVDNFLANTDEKLILFAIHRKVIRELRDRYSRVSVVVDGSITGKRRQVAFKQFTKSKQTRLLIGNIQAAGTGWNGTAASTVAFAELAWTPGEHIQAGDRPHRIGQKSTVMIYYLVARGTIEEKLCALLQEKQQTVGNVIDGKGKGEALNIMDKLTKSLLRQQ